jgi:hypothetical protein
MPWSVLKFGKHEGKMLVVLQTRVILRVGADWPDAGVTTH